MVLHNFQGFTDSEDSNGKIKPEHWKTGHLVPQLQFVVLIIQRLLLKCKKTCRNTLTTRKEVYLGK